MSGKPVFLGFSGIFDVGEVLVYLHNLFVFSLNGSKRSSEWSAVMLQSAFL